MKSTKKKRFSEILFNAFEANRIKKDKLNQVEGPIKNSEFYKKNIFTKRARIIFFFKLKYSLQKKISAKYFDSTRNYNRMIINNILSNEISLIKERYTEMLYEIEMNDLLMKYIPRKDVYIFLKYLVVVYDKFNIIYPNYIKDINVYNFMSNYIIRKQRIFDLIKENNKYVNIQKKIKKLFSKKCMYEKNLISPNLSESDSEEKFSKLKKMRSQGFDIDVDNSEDSLEKLQSLVVKIDKNLEIPKYEKIYLSKRSRSSTNIYSFFINYSKLKKPKKVKWKDLYEINNKEIKRNKKRKRTEIKIDRKKIIIEKVIDNDKKKFKKKETKEGSKQNLINKRNEINKIKKILLINKVEKDNNKIIDVIKRGFFFINHNKNDQDINNKLLISSYKKKNIKLDKCITNNNKEIKIKEKLIHLSKINNNYNINTFYNWKNYNLFKKRKYIFKNLNYSLNEYRFYNKNVNNSKERQKYYEKKVIPKLFNNNFSNLFDNQKINNPNSKINKSNLPSLVNITSISKKLNKEGVEKYCKKYNKYNNNILNVKMRNNNSLIPHKSEYYFNSVLSEKEKKDTKKYTNKMERLENCVNHYYKINKKIRKFPKYKFNYFNKINLTDTKNSKHKLKNNISIKKKEINEKRKIEFYFNKNELLNLTLFKSKIINKNKYNNFNSLLIKEKYKDNINEGKQTLNFSSKKENNKITFND